MYDAVFNYNYRHGKKPGRTGKNQVRLRRSARTPSNFKEACFYMIVMIEREQKENKHFTGAFACSILHIATLHIA